MVSVVPVVPVVLTLDIALRLILGVVGPVLFFLVADFGSLLAELWPLLALQDPKLD